MRKLCLFLCIVLYADHLLGQKMIIDHATPNCWPIISSQKISNDGKYVSYTVCFADGNGQQGSETKNAVLTIKPVDQAWKKEIPGSAGNGQYTEDNSHFIFKTAGDSLGILNLGNAEMQYIGDVSSFKLPAEGNGQWLAYHLKDSANTLIVHDLHIGRNKQFAHVNIFLFDKNGSFLLMQAKDLTFLYNLQSGNIATISHGTESSNFVFDNSGTRLAFYSVKCSDGKKIRLLRYYDASRSDTARVLVSSLTPGMRDMSIADEAAYFDNKADRIFFSIEKPSNPIEQNSLSSETQPKIWSSCDNPSGVEENVQFLAVISLNNSGKMLRVQQDVDSRSGFGSLNDYISNDGSYVLFESNLATSDNAARPDIYLVSAADGSRRLLKKRLCGLCSGFSPAGKYVIWYDKTSKNWFTYNIAKKMIRNITETIKSPLYVDDDHPELPSPEGIATWLDSDKAVLIYDRNDIWQVDPAGIKNPVNVTNGYGVKTNTEFRCLNFQDSPGIRFKDSLLLWAYNLVSKRNGFFKVKLGERKNPEQFITTSMVYYYQSSRPPQLGAETPFYPLKAKQAAVYLLSRMSSDEYPNLVLTHDFRHFTNVTDFSPQQAYNWYTNELIHWKLPSGTIAEGILYKPENFDKNKKYPVIIFSYEKCSRTLNLFLHPKLSDGVISIPWFVSNGYFVFIPDIHYRTGRPGESAFNYIVSAAKHLSGFSWIDAKHMGLQGHSFGGWETNYIVTHTFLFAAAASSEGVSDLVSDYGRFHGQRNGHYYFEQGRIGSSLWQRPDLYIINSPIFNVDKVTTPLLILNNQEDENISFDQGAGLFRALQRLHKKAWMLSYNGEHHTIEGRSNALDFSIKLSQFFDHYLKGLPAPVWMTGRTKGINGRLALDERNIEP